MHQVFNRREMIVGTAALCVSQSSAFAQAQTIPFPRELGMPPLAVPASLRQMPYKFPIPAGWMVRARAGCFCETVNVARDATVTHWQQDGTGPVQSITAVYRKPDHTGVTVDVIFAALDTPSWVSISYPFSSEHLVYKVSDDRKFVAYDQRFHSGEGKFYVAYASNEAALRGPDWKPIL